MNINPYQKGNDNYYTNPTPSNNQMNNMPPNNYNIPSNNNYNNPQPNYNPIPPNNNYNPMPSNNNYNPIPSNNYNTPNYNMNNQQPPQMNQYQRGSHLPTPSGQTLRQAAASNFLN